MTVSRKVHCLVLGVLAALSAVVFLGLASSAGAYSNDFESDTAGWFTFGGNTITQQADGYDNPGDYADGIPSAGGTNHARLGRGTCTVQVGGGGNTVNCPGPYTDWGDLNNYTWNGPYTTQVDIYLDAAYAQANADSYGGNIACLTASDPSTDATCKGTRFDYTSAINSSTPDGSGNAVHLRDFGFNVSTGLAGDSCSGFTVSAQTVVNRINANPNIPGTGTCIPDPGWYTFKHSFSEENGFLKVVMEIISVATGNTVASWTIKDMDPISTVGCNRYGWFSNQEIYGLPIDNASMTGGCATPRISDGQISPTKTTCQQYRDGTAPVLEQVRYTTRGSVINAVSPGVFFYYGTVSGTEGQTVDITQTNDGTTASPIPILNGQVVLYDASTCKVLKWDVTVNPDGTATGTLPSSGDFIVGVKYSPASLKGADAPVPTTVTYSFGTTDPATIDLAPKG